jgi:hypothetical protein
MRGVLVLRRGLTVLRASVNSSPPSTIAIHFRFSPFRSSRLTVTLLESDM